MKTAKLILHYNTSELTNSLRKMVPDAIVIDNGSGTIYDGEPEKNDVIVFKEPLGFTKGWNKAIKLLYNYYDAFWLMNSDIQINPDSIHRIETLIRRDNVHIITPSFNSWMEHCNNFGTPGERLSNVIEFTAPVIRKEVFDKIGFFDERFSLGYGVEYDFCLRAWNAGFNIYIDDASYFHHLGQQSIEKTSGGYKAYSKKAFAEMKKGMEEKWGKNWISNFAIKKVQC